MLIASGILSFEVRDRNKVASKELKINDIDVVLTKQVVLDNDGVSHDRLSIFDDSNWGLFNLTGTENTITNYFNSITY